MDKGGPVFPTLGPNYDGSLAVTDDPGMDIRDFFAAQAMVGCVEKAFSDNLLDDLGSTDAVAAAVASAAYQMADAMILARKVGAKRLLACVQHCNGYSTETLEAGPDMAELVAGASIGAELLAAGKAALESADGMDLLRKAVAKAEDRS